VDSPTGVPRIHVERADDHVLNAGLDDCGGTRRRSAFGGARLKRHIQRGIFRNCARCVSDALDLCVWEPGSPVITTRDDFVSHDKDRADRRVGASLSDAFARFCQRRAHETFIGAVAHGNETTPIGRSAAMVL
jgi:hypothetical protein